MFRFHILHLLFLTTFAAISFAIARLMDYEITLFLAGNLAVFAPMVCYSIAEMTFPRRRPFRQLARHGLLLTTLIAAVAISISFDGPDTGVAIMTIMLFFWFPQLILLKICSANRHALIGAAV